MVAVNWNKACSKWIGQVYDVAQRSEKTGKAMSVTLDVSHWERSPSKLLQPQNMPVIMTTLDVSHLERSPLKLVRLKNTILISVTLDVSHSEIGPWTGCTQ